MSTNRNENIEAGPGRGRAERVDDTTTRRTDTYATTRTDDDRRADGVGDHRADVAGERRSDVYDDRRTHGGGHVADRTHRDDYERRDDRTPWSANAFGDNRTYTRNMSWGSVIAGVITFLALLILFNLITAAITAGAAAATGDQIGTAPGIAFFISVALALLAAGYVAGALAVKSGLLHGFLTWATSLIAALVLGGTVGSTMLGYSGQAVNDLVESSTQQANAGNVTSGLWWTFGGLAIGALLAALGGLMGSRTVDKRQPEELQHTRGSADRVAR